ncbi:glutathione binding-like protein, partial [Proteus vulgaris]|uniref:glutathione binding-like protein n=1 Tax=Proteus vulgaris TaxID=585 RepID=UPI002578FEC2
FTRYATEKVPYAMKRYTEETQRLYDVLEKRLTQSPYLGGKEYSIADIATYTWVRRHEHHNFDLANFPAVEKWQNNITQRPAAKKLFG